MLQKLLSKYHFYGKVKMITNGPFVVESFVPLAHLIVIQSWLKRWHLKHPCIIMKSRKFEPMFYIITIWQNISRIFFNSQIFMCFHSFGWLFCLNMIPMQLGWVILVVQNWCIINTSVVYPIGPSLNMIM